MGMKYGMQEWTEGLTCHPYGMKNLKIDLWVTKIPAFWTAHNDVINNENS